MVIAMVRRRLLGWLRLGALARLALVFSLAFGTSAAQRMPADPALAMAMAGGALCLAEGPAGLPAAGHGHDQCLICQGSFPVAGLAVVQSGLAQFDAGVVGDVSPAAPVWEARRAAYASRAPPGVVG
jgi:hypothetical protein